MFPNSNTNNLTALPKGIPLTFLKRVYQSKLDEEKAKEDKIFLTPPAEKPQNPMTFDLPKWINLGEDEKFLEVEQPIPVQNVYENLENDMENDEMEGVTLNSGEAKRIVNPFAAALIKRAKEYAAKSQLESTTDAEINKETTEHVPVFQRDYILASKDEIVAKYLPQWPWAKGLDIDPLKKEIVKQPLFMVEYNWVKVIVTGYPHGCTKEDILDICFDAIDDKNFIPSFIEFSDESCVFLILRCRDTHQQVEKLNNTIQVDEDIAVYIHLRKMHLKLVHLEFIPRLILRRRLTLATRSNTVLDLSGFCLQKDVSHFIYFPLNLMKNQHEIIQVQSSVKWSQLTELYLANNRMTSIRGFNLYTNVPKLQILDLSSNFLERFSEILECRGLLLRNLSLEGNPLCLDFVDADEYVDVIKTLFPTVRKIDGVRIPRKMEFPDVQRNYCPPYAIGVVEKFLDIFFSLLDQSPEKRKAMSELYSTNATLSISSRRRLRNHPDFRYFRDLFLHMHDLREGVTDYLHGDMNIARLFTHWPIVQHVPQTFQVDVLHHTYCTTILRIDGVLKLPQDSLAEEEPLVLFSRTIVLHTEDGVRYKIHNELITWDIPSDEYNNAAFRVNIPKTKELSLKLPTNPPDELKPHLTDLFMKITHSTKEQSESYLTRFTWNFNLALEKFMSTVNVQ